MSKIYLSSKGIKQSIPNNPGFDNSTIINHQLELAKPNNTIVIPEGEYTISKAIEQNKSIPVWKFSRS